MVTPRHDRTPRRSLGQAGIALLAGLAMAVGLAPARAAETCRFAGTTSHDGRLAARTEVSEAGGLLTVDVAVTLAASAWLANVQYMGEEISTWRAGQLQSVAVNARTIIDGEIKRQQWDVFVRDAGGLRARRVQAKTLTDFRRLHPGFVRHWAPAGFGEPWLQDYGSAAPERRPDLDLPASALTSGLRTPLALALYWSRFLPAGGGAAPMFLPGFKRDARAALEVGPVSTGEGWRRWQATLRHPALDGSSKVAAWVSPDNYLLQLAFDLHAQLGSGQALIRAQGCQGLQVPPG